MSIDLKSYIVDVPDFPKPGIVFKVAQVLSKHAVNMLDLDTRLVGRAGRPIYAALFPYETQGEYRVRFARALGTHWIPVARVQQASIWRYAPPAAP